MKGKLLPKLFTICVFSCSCVVENYSQDLEIQPINLKFSVSTATVYI